MVVQMGRPGARAEFLGELLGHRTAWREPRRKGAEFKRQMEQSRVEVDVSMMPEP